MRYSYRYRSYFWPALLILAGIVALLVNTGQISVDRLYQLVNLWPVILVVIGLELIIRRTVHGLAGNVAVALIIVIAVVGAAAYVTVAPNPAATHTLDASSQAGEVTEGRLQIDAGASTVTISGSSEVGSDLYRAHIEYSGAKPSVDVDGARGAIHISQANNNFAFFQPRRFTANVRLNPGIAWAIQVNGGASTTTINGPQLHVTSIEINSGAAHDEITLGPASGMVPVQISGGALTVHVHRPSGTQALVQVEGGGLTLDADGRSMHGFGKLSYQSPGFSSASDSYTIQVSGGACTVSLDTKTESG